MTADTIIFIQRILTDKKTAAQREEMCARQKLIEALGNTSGDAVQDELFVATENATSEAKAAAKALKEFSEYQW